MPESQSPLTLAETQRLFRAALGTGITLQGWTAPEPSALAPYFPGYEIEALIARGGMGAVYRARQLSLDRIVAIKLLPFDLGVRDDFADRFRREAAALARLNHPGIVTVHDFGQADDGHHFIVMEHVEGSDLATRLKAHGPLPQAEAVSIVRQVCEALHYAHQHGVVHRDIKPANILLTTDGRVKVSDFGIAQLAHEQAAGDLTVIGTLLGTPDYTAPEQRAAQGSVDHRADIFSVGVMLYELLTGTLPRGVFRPVSELVPGSHRLDAVLARAMQSEPGRRYGDVIELSTELMKPRRRVGPWMLGAAVLLAATWWLWPRAPFVNSLGMTFMPAGTEHVLFCTTETRVRDFDAFARAQQFPAAMPMYVNYDGTREGWVFKQASWRSPTIPQTPDHPVVSVALPDAIAFCEWLTQHERASQRIGAKDRYRLPTNAEWSTAAGITADAHDPAGTYPWGSDYPPPADAGNYAGEELRGDTAFSKLPIIAKRDDKHAYTAPVGSFRANSLGLHDMGGNVAEWVQSESETTAQTRGATWWDSSAAALDAGARPTVGKQTRSFILGFRIVLERSP